MPKRRPPFKPEVPEFQEEPQTPSQVIEPEPVALPEPTWIVDLRSAESMFHSLETPQPRVPAAKLVEALPDMSRTLWVIRRMQSYLKRGTGVLYVPNELAELSIFAGREKVVVGEFTAIL